MEKSLKNPKKKRIINTRELTKNEKFLLSILGAIILLWIVYKFIITPQTHKMEMLNAQKMEYQNKIDDINETLRKEDNITKEWDTLHKEKNKIVSHYFPKLDQAQIIYLLNDLIENDNISAADLNFTRPDYEEIDGFQVKNMDISIPYGGSYEGIVDVINALKNSPRKILVDSLSMDRNKEGVLNGNMALKVYSLEGIAEADENVVYIDTASQGLKDTPFSAYDSFTGDKPEDDSISIDSKLEKSGGESISTEDFLRKELLHDFELKNYTFIPSSPMVKGNSSLSTISKSNKYSLRLEYNILALEDENRAYIDLSKSNITLKYPPSSLGMWVYSYDYSYGTLGLILKGQAGETVDIKVREGFNWIGWQYIESVVPMDINLYPLVVDKIYYELPYNREGFGVLLLDKLEAIYPKIEGEESGNSSRYFYHIVQKGETIESLSQRYYGTKTHKNEIMKLNDIKPEDILKEGKILVLVRR